MRRRHIEQHLIARVGWLRAAVLGANDGIVSTASLVLGVAASGASSTAIVTAGIAGLVAGALSMAAGEYVSVSSQRDAEQADIRLEERELLSDPQGELHELAGFYEARGLSPALAGEVAQALSSRGALQAHLRDELGLDEQRLRCEVELQHLWDLSHELRRPVGDRRQGAGFMRDTPDVPRPPGPLRHCDQRRRPPVVVQPDHVSGCLEPRSDQERG